MHSTFGTHSIPIIINTFIKIFKIHIESLAEYFTAKLNNA
tara:strand:+ start:309 stop:428 length:120 start_codon:yes stop_codon:yes gene_type:complete